MAAAYRDALRTVRDVAERQVVQSLKGENVDVFGFFESGQDVAVVVLVVRGGVLQDRREFFFEKAQELEPARFSRGVPAPVLRREPVSSGGGPPARRDRGPGAPRGVPGRAPGSEGRGPRSRSAAPRPSGCGWRRSTPGSATASASAARAATRRWPSSGSARAIGLAIPPHRIEAFDISHLQGTDSVASHGGLRGRPAQEVGLPPLQHRVAGAPRAGRLPEHGRGRGAALPARPDRRGPAGRTSSSSTAAGGSCRRP